MSDTVFVTMYNPNLGNVQVDAPLQAVSTYASHGWLLLDPQATPPPVASPYLSQPAADSRYLRDWAGAEVLTAGAVRVAPDGHIIVRAADGTTRSTYDTTEQALWTTVGGGSASDSSVAALIPGPSATATALRAAYGAVTLVTATGTADSAAILAAFNGMKVGGHATGTLVVKGVAALDAALVLDGGYPDTENVNNWPTASATPFRLVGSFTPAVGLGAALTVKGFYGAQVDVQVDGGGYSGSATDGAMTSGSAVLTTALASSAVIGQAVSVWGAGAVAGGVAQPLMATVSAIGTGNVTLNATASTTVSGAQVWLRDVALHVENHIGLKLSLYGKNFAGTLLHADATGDTTKRMRSCLFDRIVGINNGSTLFWKNIEAFGSFGRVWSNTQHTDYLGFCADTGWSHYEGGITASGTAPDVYLWLESCNNFNAGPVTFGDRATEANLKFSGATDMGSFQRIRSSGSGLAPTSPTSVGLKMMGVSSVDIDNLWTFKNATDLLIIGGGTHGIRVKQMFSETQTNQSVVIQDDGSGAAPIVDIKGHWRFTLAEPVVIGSGLGAARIKLSGFVDSNCFQAGASGKYVISSASSAATIDVDGLTQVGLSGTSGFTNHTGTILGTADSHLAKNPPSKGTIWVADGTGQLTQVAAGTNGQVLGYGASGAVAPVTPSGGGGGGGTSYFDPASFTSYLAWVMDPAACGQGTATISATGKPQYSLVPVSGSITATNLSVVLATLGSATTWTSGQNFLALYDSTGALLGQTNDITSLLSAAAVGAEIKAALQTPVALAAGRVYAYALLNWSAGTAPTLFGAKTIASTTVNLGTPAAFPRSASDSIARTAPVSSKAISSLGAGQQSLMWAAIS